VDRAADEVFRSADAAEHLLHERDGLFQVEMSGKVEKWKSGKVEK
jgi:hypothetical protein